MSQHIDTLVVYGDSYSSIKPTSKKTNGPLWNEQLAKSWNTELVSLATPGATFCKNNKNNASWLQKQVGSYTSKDGQETVHAMFLGVTDLIETKGEAKKTKEWIKCIEDQVTSLCSSNPNSRIIIMGVPALEFSPYALTHSTATNHLKQNILDFNVALEEKVTDWQEKFENVLFFDTYLVFSEIFGDPSETKMVNLEEAYWDTCQGKCAQEMDTYLWWDSVHITGAGHKAISNTIQARELFNIKATESDSFESTDGLISKDYIRVLSWIILASILFMVFYLFRHNRVFVSLKKKIQANASKVYPSNRNNHEYALV
ncbi:hypothetical protein HPULCUR_001896 [Helicostylum pulchrum]|uniref:Carbohydrate esterase family 16 protein n=1 Tax=Helicostylum pulchrum TaxID=562976 RepID=A0ABP9XNZ3_9FUNG